MKTLKKRIFKITIILMVILWIPLVASAADMWAETPDLNDDAEKSSFIAESHTLKYNSAKVDMWAETPNLDDGSEDHIVQMEGEYRFINNFNLEMYAETPGLNNTLPRPHVETEESTLLATGRNFR